MGFREPRESDVQRACLDWLAAWGAFPVRVNSGGLTVGKRYVRFNGEPGCSDVLCVLPGGRFLALELKRPLPPGGRDRTSPRRRAEQQSFRARVVRAGGLAVVATSLDELRRALSAEGYEVGP